MAKIVIAGGGIVGLCTAMMLGADGHEVTVLERDPSPPPTDSEEAWKDWERQGVNQFRLLHFFLPRWRAVVAEELPDLLPPLKAAGALIANPVVDAPAEITGGPRPGDERFEAVTGRRPVFEAIIARLVADMPNIDIRRGQAVVSLIPGPSDMPGVPHVAGVRTETGEEFTGDVVLDMMGRRSQMPALLAAIGAQAPIEEEEDSGFVYYGRYFRSEDGSLPFMFGGGLQHYGSISTLTLPADNGTWGIGLITSAKDPALRKLKDVEVWNRTLAAFPLIAHWNDGLPDDDGTVTVMARIPDRIRRYVVDGAPVATGVLAVADAWSCTNPSLGRGMSIGMIHAAALRGVLRTEAVNDPGKLALAWDDATEASVMPYFRATRAFDRHRLAEIDAICQGQVYDPGDRLWDLTRAIEIAFMSDPELMRPFLEIAMVLATPDEVFDRPGLAERVLELVPDWRSAPSAGPDREQLLAVVEG
jgi:2-polyprenyl-6-methoxyphenol hydroxylase-like FAD-dependent oxidoreductase